MSFFSKIRGTIETIFQLGLGGPQLKNTAGAIEARDPADAAYAILRGAPAVGPNDATMLAYVNTLAIVARACTTAALPAYTYANGSSGVGATITGNANGALAAIDGVTLSAGDVLLVQNGAAFADNGLYTVTQIGDAGTPFILTRSIASDTQNKILSATIKIREGNSRRAAIYEYCGAVTITIGTTALSWIRVDISRTPNEYVELVTDFDEQTVPLTGNSVLAGMWPGFLTLVGTASAAPRTVANGTERGVFRLSASTTTGSASLTFSVGGFPIMVTTDQYFELEVVVFGPNALSDVADTFRMMAGLSQAVGVGGTDGVWCEYTQATSTSWLAVTRTGSVSSTQAGPTVQVNTKVRMKLIKRPGETAFEVYFNGAQYTSLSAHQPLSVPLTPNVTLTKSLGNVNARSFDIDFWRVVQAWPNRRAA